MLCRIKVLEQICNIGSSAEIVGGGFPGIIRFGIIEELFYSRFLNDRIVFRRILREGAVRVFQKSGNCHGIFLVQKIDVDFTVGILFVRQFELIQKSQIAVIIVSGQIGG